MNDSPLIVQLLQSSTLNVAVPDGLEKHQNQTHSAAFGAVNANLQSILKELTSISGHLNNLNARLERVENSVKALRTLDEKISNLAVQHESSTQQLNLLSDAVRQQNEDIKKERLSSTEQLAALTDTINEHIEKLNDATKQNEDATGSLHPLGPDYAQPLQAEKFNNSRAMKRIKNDFYLSLSTQDHTQYAPEIIAIHKTSNSIELQFLIMRILKYYNNIYI